LKEGTKDAAREIAPVKEAENVQLRRRKLPIIATRRTVSRDNSHCVPICSPFFWEIVIGIG
jgi:hypothetical protein